MKRSREENPMEGDKIDSKICWMCWSSKDEDGNTRKEMTEDQITKHFLYHVDKNCNIHKINLDYHTNPTPPTFFVCDYCEERKTVLKDIEAPYKEANGKLRCNNCGGGEAKFRQLQNALRGKLDDNPNVDFDLKMVNLKAHVEPDGSKLLQYYMRQNFKK
jgi:hypothetical protein